MLKSQKQRSTDVDLSRDNPLNVAITTRDSNTIEMVRAAISHRNVLLAYQPVMRADRSGMVAFYEGLVRVLDDTGRIIPAKDFILTVENSETGRELDVIALTQGLQALHQHPSLRLSINMSARSIGYLKWMRVLNRWLDKDTTLGERLILEITESSAIMVPELVIDFMSRLQHRGICFAMDDFGAGHTAIRYFKDFFFDIVKIDGQFIKGISSNSDNRAVTAALVSIARHFDMLTVAEFVENAEDESVLIELGVDCLQGYHYGAATTRPSFLQKRQKRASA